MVSKQSGFTVEVQVEDATPRVRISNSSGCIVDTSSLSCTGMDNIADAFRSASRMSARLLDDYWRKQHAEAVAAKTHENARGENVSGVAL